MFQAKHIGSISWKGGDAKFDPPIIRSDPSHKFEDDLNQWMSRAYARSIGALG